jgi:hypothetical protein
MPQGLSPRFRLAEHDGELWLYRDDESACKFTGRCLGPAHDDLYMIVPLELWDRLGQFIAERERANREERETRELDERDFQRSKF